MRKLEEIVQAEEQKLLDDEKALEEDAAKFDTFLKENDKNSVEAIKRYVWCGRYTPALPPSEGVSPPRDVE